MDKNITPSERHKKNINNIIVISSFIIISLVSIITYLLNKI